MGDADASMPDSTSDRRFDAADPAPTALRRIVGRTIVAHTLTYFLVGWLAFVAFDYQARFSTPPLNAFMRPTDHPLVAAGVLFQPLRGLLFGFVLYLLRTAIFQRPRGWLVAWVMFVVVGIFSTFGPGLGSIEGLLFTTVPPSVQLGGGLLEVLTQSFLLSVLTFHWVNRGDVRWINWSILAAFVLALGFSALGVLLRVAS